MNELILKQIEDGLVKVTESISSEVSGEIVAMGATDAEFIRELITNKLSKKVNDAR